MRMATGARPDGSPGVPRAAAPRRARQLAARACSEALIKKLATRCEQLGASLDEVLRRVAFDNMHSDRLACIEPSLAFITKGQRPPPEVALRRNVAAHVPDDILGGRHIAGLSLGELRRVQKGMHIGQVAKAEASVDEETERKAKCEAEDETKRKDADEIERKAKFEADRKAKEESKRKDAEEIDRKAKDVIERNDAEGTERKAKCEADRKAKDEIKRKDVEETERKAQSGFDRKDEI